MLDLHVGGDHPEVPNRNLSGLDRCYVPWISLDGLFDGTTNHEPHPTAATRVKWYAYSLLIDSADMRAMYYCHENPIPCSISAFASLSNLMASPTLIPKSECIRSKPSSTSSSIVFIFSASNCGARLENCRGLDGELRVGSSSRARSHVDMRG